MFFSKFVRLGLMGLLGLLALKSYAASTPSVFSDPAQNIIVSQHQPQFTITLASNPTTGYRWYLLKYDAHFMTLINHTYSKPTSLLPGAGGQETWIFGVNTIVFKAPQISKIDLLYARPWNLKDHSKSVEFTVVAH